jgi:hypothetical protein
VLPPDYARVYAFFVASAASSRTVWSLECCGDVVAVGGGGVGCLPLWPEEESAAFFAARNWPDLHPVQLSLRLLLRTYLPMIAEAGLPAGVGVAPFPNAVLVPARRLRRDLLRARRCLR